MLPEDLSEERAVFVTHLVCYLIERKGRTFQKTLGGLDPESLQIEKGRLAGRRFEPPFEGATAHAATSGETIDIDRLFAVSFQTLLRGKYLRIIMVLAEPVHRIGRLGGSTAVVVKSQPFAGLVGACKCVEAGKGRDQDQVGCIY
jgi:hypothetical protein